MTAEISSKMPELPNSPKAPKALPFDADWLRQLADRIPTPFYLYDEAGIRAAARALNAAFAWNGQFQEYYAVKACPNPTILEILKGESAGADCSSLPELLLAERAGITGENIVFTSNNTPANEFVAAKKLGAVINLDDITHVKFLEKHAGLPELVSFRYNPGPLRQAETVIGNPVEAKYGLTRDQLFEGYALLRQKGVKRFGLHTMLASNLLDNDFFIETGRMLFEMAVELHEKLGIRIELANIGGGMGIPYKPGDIPLDLPRIGEGIRALYESMIVPAGLHPMKIATENARCITGPHGYLITRVIHEKNIYRRYIGVDACMANLMRPALYGAYHHITVLGKDDSGPMETVDVVGSLCENNDKFAIQRSLPKMDIGDLLVLHDAGAHGHAMGFQYNGKLRSAEYLLEPNGNVRMIRRAETVGDYFATLDF